MFRLSWHRTRRVFLIATGVLLVLAAAGALYQSVSVRREAGRFPPPGRLVDIGGGRRLHLLCIGDGQPTVIFEPTGFGNALSAWIARQQISAYTRVGSYDRMGTGWSDPGPATISAGMLTDDLERLLDRAGIPPPYLLVPSSIGGLTAEMFARRHPDRVVGAIFLDTATSDLLARSLPKINWATTQAACLVKVAARLGVLRLVDPFDFRRTGSADEARAVALMYRVEPMATLCGLVRGAAISAAEFRAAAAIPASMPLVVMSAESSGSVPSWVLPLQEKYRLHQTFARRSSRGRWQLVPGGFHIIASNRPEVVVDAVLAMLAASRGGTLRPAGPS
jgi:pimeloyl-ACP methyl ester carboxylesterase